MDEAQILRGLKERDLKAIEMLYNSVFTSLRFLAERITKHEAEAEDIAQNSLAKLWERGVADFNSLDHVKSYLKKIVENAAVDYLRKQKSVKSYQRHLAYTQLESEELLVNQSRYETELTKVIYAEVEKLSPQTREVFKAVYLKKMPRAQVAQNLGISINTVYVHCSKAINELKQVISERELMLFILLFNLSNN